MPLSNMNRLSQVQSDKDIKALSHAQFPGPHCPLFGAIMTASYVKDLAVLVIGTEECTYYGKDFAMLRQNGRDKVYSAVMEQHDITFGCEDGLRDIILEIDREEKPEALLVITTCVVELIGEDVASVLYSLRNEVDTTLLVAKTEHFKCNSHIDGIEKTFEQFSLLMEDQTKLDKAVNILGFKYVGIEKTELAQALNGAGAHLHLTLPSDSTVEAIRKAPAASLNIVVESTALGLAKEMEKTFGIPYVDFTDSLVIDSVTAAYREIEDHLGIAFGADLYTKAQSTADQCATLKEEIEGSTFIYGNTPWNVFDFTQFMLSLGVQPEVLQVRELYAGDMYKIQKILSHDVDPHAVRMANIAPLREVYGLKKPTYYFGHENPGVLKQHGVKQVVSDVASKRVGYERISELLTQIKEGRGMRALMGAPGSVYLTTQVKDKVKNMKHIPKPMKMMINAMDDIPEKMAKAILKMKDQPGAAMAMMGGGKHASV